MGHDWGDEQPKRKIPVLVGVAIMFLILWLIGTALRAGTSLPPLEPSLSPTATMSPR